MASVCSLDSNTNAALIQKIRRPPRKNDLIHSGSVSTSAGDDESCSSDSNPTAVEEVVSVDGSAKKSRTAKLLTRLGRKISKNAPPILHAHSE